MTRRTLIRNAVVVLPDVAVEGWLLVEDGRIAAVGAGRAGRPGPGVEDVDAAGCTVIPGFIDLHSDVIEREVEPRPGALFPVELATRELERKLAGHGITTIFHSVSFAKQELGVRSHDLAARLVETVRAQADTALIRTRVHLRYEVTDWAALPVVRDLLRRRWVDLLSFMDHTPGQGQFRDIEQYRRWLEKSYGIGETEFRDLMARKTADRRSLDTDLAALAAEARACGVPLASHDDDTPEKVDLVRNWGVGICEFPVCLEAARRAAEHGMVVCVGAPNVVRGGSQANNLRALDAIQAGVAHVLCSDYYPPALLHAVFRLAAGLLTLPQAVAMATLRPARAVGLDGDLGSLEVGKLADLVLVRTVDSLPVVAAVMVGGRWVYRVVYGTTEGSAAGVAAGAGAGAAASAHRFYESLGFQRHGYSHYIPLREAEGG